MHAENRDPAPREGGFAQFVGLRIAVFAAALAVLHLIGAGANRESLITSTQASDTFASMQGRMTREAVFRTASSMPGIDSDTRAADLGEATRLGQDNPSGSGIAQMAARGTGLRRQSAAFAGAAEGLELGESALQLAIFLLALALITGAGPITTTAATTTTTATRLVKIATYLAGAGVALAGLTALAAALI